MKLLTHITISLSILILMSGCGSTPSWVEKGPMNDPEWIAKGSEAFKEQSQGVEALWAVGSVQGINNPSLAWEIAEGRGRAQLARIFSTKSDYDLTENTTIDFGREKVCEKDDDGHPLTGTCVPSKAIRQDMTREVKTMSGIVVTGARQVDRFYDKEQGIYYVLVKMPWKYIGDDVLTNQTENGGKSITAEIEESLRKELF